MRARSRNFRLTSTFRLFRALFKPEGRIGDHCLLGVLQERQIRQCVTDIVEAVRRKSLLQMLQLVPSGEVHPAVAGDYVFKDSQVGCDLSRQDTVGPGGQVEFPASGMLVSKVVQQGTVVRQVRGIECDHRGHLRLQIGFALERPQWRVQKSQGMATSEDHQRVNESVRLDQGTVQIDTERTACLDRHWRLHNLKFGHSEQFSCCHVDSKRRPRRKAWKTLRFPWLTPFAPADASIGIRDPDLSTRYVSNRH